MMCRTVPIFGLLAVLGLTLGCGSPEMQADPDEDSAAAVDGLGDSGSSTSVSDSAGLPRTLPGAVDMSAERLDRIPPAMQAYVDDGRLAGVMTMVARRGQVVHWDAVGMRDLEAADPLEPDDIFRIFSMTKPVTSTAVMMLVEEARIALDDPLSKFIPAFAEVTVLTAAGERVPPNDAITIQHLLTHTSGLTYGFFGDSPVDRLYNESGVFVTAQGLDNFAAGVASLPLLAHPGELWNYSVSTDILGRVIEVASGQTFDQFVKTRILDPLDMQDTAFMVPADKRNRFTASYARPDGALRATDSPTDGQYTRPPAWLSGGGGLTSTASDYIRFAQMLLQEGELDGVRILTADTVRQMRTNHLPDSLIPIAVGNYLSPAYGFGLGFAVAVDTAASPEPDNDGVFRWAGAANTFFWIDPQAELIGMVWMQYGEFAAYEIEREFQTLVYEALE